MDKTQNFIHITQMLFKARDLTHIAHLKTNSYAEHMALDEFYEELLPLLDDMIETFQGENKVLLDITIPESNFESPIQFLETLLELTNAVSFSSAVQNVLDDVNTLIASTLYKLRFLK